MKRAEQSLADLPAAHGASELDRVDYLDGWRGLAISLVLIAHFVPHEQRYDFGRAGVDIFFCLSGFLMSNILFVRRVQLGTFYKRRISRIIPVFLLYCVVVHMGAWLVTGTFSPTEFLSTITFLRTYFPVDPHIWRTPLPIEHLWSLNAEEHCYVFLSLLTLFVALRKREGWVLVGAGILTIGIHFLYIYFPAIEPPSGRVGTEVVASFLLISAGYFLIREKFVRWVRPWMPIAALIVALASYDSRAPWWSSILVSPFLLAFCVNHLSQMPSQVRRALGSQWIRLLGIWSYSIYIWQQPFHKFQSYFPPGAALATAMIVSVCSFYFFENPLRTWLNKH